MRGKLLNGYYSYRYSDVMAKDLEEWLWAVELLDYNVDTADTFRQLQPGSLVLDAGCGVGYLEYYLLKTKYDITIHALDISEEQINVAQQILSEHFPDFNERVTFVVADLMGYLADTSHHYDCIALMDVLEHFPKDQILQLLERIYGRLNSGGTLIVRVPNLDNPLNISTFYNDFTHEVAFTTQSLRQVLGAAGFTVGRIYYEMLPPLPQHRRSLWGRLKIFLVVIRKRVIRLMLGIRYHAMTMNLIAIAHQRSEKPDE